MTLLASSHAQEITAPPAELPAAPDTTQTSDVPPGTPATETTPEAAAQPEPAAVETPEADRLPTAVNSSSDLPSPAPTPSKLTAARVSYENGVIFAEGDPDNPVRFESTSGSIVAQKIQLDTVKRTANAQGQVRLERERVTERKELRPDALRTRRRQEVVRDVATGENLFFDFVQQQGKLDNAYLQTSGFTLTAEALEINGRRYVARNIKITPGGLSPEETKIYGTPPLNLRAREVTATSSPDEESPRLAVRGAGLYFKNTRILPVPSYVASTIRPGGRRENQAFQITPRIGFNSADRLLITTKLRFPLSADGQRLAAEADIGLSQRVGFRGGASLVSDTGAGLFRLRLRQSDIVTTQLTNRIELDRLPEATYSSPYFFRFPVAGGREAGFRFNASLGDFTERTIGLNRGRVSSTRSLVNLTFTTRLNDDVDGPYLELFAGTARYSNFNSNYTNLGFEVGYEGTLLRNVRGQVSYRSNSLRGNTPFRFDLVEIEDELRSTLDIQVTPRYIVPLDLRYDISRKSFRDKTFGVLRSYKYFAYGVVYQTARKDLRLEFRQAF